MLGILISTYLLSGNNTKGEKDSRMIRDFRGETMHMQLIVDNVVCKRVYRRITEE